MTLVIAAAFFGCQGTRPTNIGVNNGELTPCPDKPNCVNSAAADERHQIAAVDLPGDHRAEFDRLKAMVTAMPRVTIVTDSPDYLHAEFTSKLMRYVDDLELYFNAAAGRAEVRSASRLGQKDFGVNRERVEGIRAAFVQTVK